MYSDDAAERKRRESMLTIFLTALTGAGLLLFLIVVSGGFFFYVVLAVLALGLFGWIHYLLWGRSLMEHTAGEREEQALRDQADTSDLSVSEVREMRRPGHQ